MSDDAADEQKFLNVRETAARLGVHENTVRNWTRDGILASARLPGTKFHRFDERDVERLRQERGAVVSSVERERLTIGPELVDATQLRHWADTRDSQDRFPELVRRLLASTPGITNVSMRAGDGVSARGWDGRADSTGTQFLPGGKLMLELGVGADPKAKADEDYEKRRSDPAASSSVFVFLTPRRWPGADAWVTTRRAEAVFADVRVIHADDLEGWLVATPSVHYWISERLGRRPQDAQTLESWWSRFTSQTTPVLPGALFLAGRESEQERLTEFLAGPPDVIAVQAAWRDEAIAFVCATIEILDHPDGVQPPLLVSSAEVWDRVIERPGRMTLIPLFDAPDIATAHARGHHIVLPLGREAVTLGAKIELPRPHRRAAGDALEAAGVESDRAYRLGALARRSMPSLVRSLARDSRIARPPWSEPESSAILAPLALIGGWTASDDDRGVASRITGEAWPRIERTLAHWVATDDPPFVRSSTQWHLASTEEAFLVLHDALTSVDLQRWHEIAADVLSEMDPRLELSRDEQPMAGAMGVRRHYSSVLRRGIAEGIALVGSIGDDRLADVMTGADHARAVIRNILDKAKADDSGRLWCSLEDILPLLAEAAPEVFLDAVHDDLDQECPLLATMFQDDDHSSWLYSSSPHTGLLWALETLCWSSESILEASRALARLQQVDPGGRLSNRPLESLQSILVGWIRHTSAPIALRVRALEAICSQMPDVGWPLVLALWPKTHGVSSPPSAPRFRDWKPETPTISIAEWVEYIEHLVRLAIDLAGDDAERWAQLVEHLGPLPPSDRDRVLSSLEHLADPESLDHDQRLLIWERLHKEISHNRRFASAEWSMAEGPLARMEAIAARLEPTVDVERHAYLFDWRPDLPEVDLDDYGAYDERLLALRKDAVTQTLAGGSTDPLRRLALRSAVPRQLGVIVGVVAPEEFTPQLLEWLDSADENLCAMASSWASRRLHDDGLPWLRETLARPEMAQRARRVAFALGAPPSNEVWNALHEIDQDLEQAYWKAMNPWFVEPVDAERAARELLAHDRPLAAIDLLASGRQRETDENTTLTPALVQEVLDAAMDADPKDHGAGQLGYEIGLLLDYLEAQGVDAMVLARYEFMFFRLLDDYRQPRALFSAMSSDASLFVDLVKRVYRGKNQPKRQLDEKDQALAHHSWWVLHHWRSLPGHGGNGDVDREHLARWVQTARLAFSESDRADIGDEEIGRVLAASPTGTDDVWPAEPVRDILESIGSTSIETGMHVGVYNDRGGTSRGVYDGGQQERDIAATYREWSTRTAGSWPRTSRVLRRLAETYERDARMMDDRAEITADTE